MGKMYFMVFKLNYLDKGKSKEIQMLLDVQRAGSDYDPLFIREFQTKAGMIRFYEEFKEGIREYYMLKPVS